MDHGLDGSPAEEQTQREFGSICRSLKPLNKENLVGLGGPPEAVLPHSTSVTPKPDGYPASTAYLE